MKRKLALMLAAVMTLSTLPSMNLFAASPATRVNRTYSYLDDETVMHNGTYVPTVGGYGSEAASVLTLDLDGATTFSSGDSFTLTLSNADWFFRNDATSTIADGAYTSFAALADLYAPSFLTSDVSLTGLITAGSLSTTDIKGTGATYAVGSYTWITNTNGTNTSNAVKGYEGILADSAVGTATPKYLMAVTGTRADVVIVGTPTTISIPLVLLTDDRTEPVTVTVSNNRAGVSAGTYQIVGGVSGGTTAAFDGTASGRDTIVLDPLMIKETRTGTIESGTQTFRIGAPTGYDFVDTTAATNSNSSTIGLGGATVALTNYTKSVLTFTLTGVTQSTTFNGQVNIEKLEIKPRSSNTWGAVTGLRIYGDNSGIDNVTFGTTIANRVDYGVTLVAATEKEGVPELYTGVMPSYGALSVLGEDTYKLMEVSIVENAENSWWTTRKTVLTLPDGVLVRAVEVTDTDELQSTLDNGQYVDEKNDTTLGLIDFDGNEINIYDVKAGDPDKSLVSLDIWVSVSNRMAGKDITIEVSGGGMSGTDLPEALVVATAVAPITVETTITSVAIGRNSQATADITITENGIGALADDEDLLIVMTDYYGDPVDGYLDFTSANFEVEGDLEISGSRASASGNYGSISGSSGQLRVTIDAASRIEASKILISDVKVSTATTLPAAEKDPYKILVYGSAIAANFDSTKSSTDAKEQGYFRDITKDAGIFAEYVKTTSATSQGGYDPQSVFSLATTGDIVYTIDGATYTADADMVPFNENGTIYVSLRLIAEAFGTTPVWSDANKSATILAGSSTIAKFVKDSEFMVTGLGEPVPMVDANYQNTPAIIRNDRLFVPFRWMGIAMGVNDDDISWDDETKTVWFNK